MSKAAPRKYYALKSPEGRLYHWSLAHKLETVKARTRRWCGWEYAEKKGYSIVRVALTEIPQ